MKFRFMVPLLGATAMLAVWGIVDPPALYAQDRNARGGDADADGGDGGRGGRGSGGDAESGVVTVATPSSGVVTAAAAAAATALPTELAATVCP